MDTPHNISVVGFGNQGRAWVANLRDSGWSVEALFRSRNEHYREAEKLGHRVGLLSERLPSAKAIALLIPDDAMPSFCKEYGSLLKPGQSLIFAHGYSLHYRTAEWPKSVDWILVAPKGIGTAVREQFVKGSGVPAVLSVANDATGNARQVALSVAEGIGAARFGIFEATVQEEVEADLFSEQALLCGGLPALISSTFNTLVNSGVSPEVAYLECVHELKFIADLIQEKGVHGMLRYASPTARFGGLRAADQMSSAEIESQFKRLFKSIRSGEFQKVLSAEATAGFPFTENSMSSLKESLLEKTGKAVRK